MSKHTVPSKLHVYTTMFSQSLVVRRAQTPLLLRSAPGHVTALVSCLSSARELAMHEPTAAIELSGHNIAFAYAA